MDEIQLSKSLAAAMQIRLPGTVGKIASKMRYIDEVAPRLRKGGLVLPIHTTDLDKVHAVGISTQSRSIPAFGGLLYGAAALRFDVFIEQRQMVTTHQDSRVDINDMNFIDAAQRLTWHEYRLAYELLDDMFEHGTLPDLVLLDLPLLIMRGGQASCMVDEDVANEWEAVMDIMSRFWGRWLSSCYPLNSSGPMVVSLGRKYLGAILNAIQLEGHNGSLEPLSDDVVELIQNEWIAFRQAGIIRLLHNLLHVTKRTAAYPYSALGKEVLRSAPRSLSMHGLIGFHIKIGYRTPVWLVESIGPANAWNSEGLNRLASLIQHLTLYDHSSMLPLPLWYAKKLVYMRPEILRTYRNRMVEMLAEGTIDQAWLEGIETLAEEDARLPDIDLEFDSSSE